MRKRRRRGKPCEASRWARTGYVESRLDAATSSEQASEMSERKKRKKLKWGRRRTTRQATFVSLSLGDGAGLGYKEPLQRERIAIPGPRWAKHNQRGDQGYSPSFQPHRHRHRLILRLRTFPFFSGVTTISLPSTTSSHNRSTSCTFHRSFSCTSSVELSATFRFSSGRAVRASNDRHEVVQSRQRTSSKPMVRQKSILVGRSSGCRL